MQNSWPGHIKIIIKSFIALLANDHQHRKMWVWMGGAGTVATIGRTQSLSPSPSSFFNAEEIVEQLC